MLGRKLLLDTSNRSQRGPSHGNEFPWTRLMNILWFTQWVSLFCFDIVIFLTFNSKSMLSKAMTNPGWEAIWCCFNKSWASSDAWASRQSSKQLPEQAWTWSVTLSVSSFSLTCSWDILSLAVISTSLWWAPRISSLLKVDVFEHVSLSLHSLLRFAFKERISLESDRMLQLALPVHLLLG